MRTKYTMLHPMQLWVMSYCRWMGMSRHFLWGIWWKEAAGLMDPGGGPSWILVGLMDAAAAAVQGLGVCLGLVVVVGGCGAPRGYFCVWAFLWRDLPAYPWHCQRLCVPHWSSPCKAYRYIYSTKRQWEKDAFVGHCIFCGTHSVCMRLVPVYQRHGKAQGFCKHTCISV